MAVPTEPVIVRELGPRDLFEVPRSEVQALIEQLGLDGLPPGDWVNRAVLDVYGLVRLTTKTAEFLRSCQEYTYTT